MRKLFKLQPILIVGYSFLPLIASAQAVDFPQFVIRLRGVINTIVGLLFAVAALIFLWGVVKFIAASSDETARNKAKGVMTWGIIGMAVMASVWGLVNIVVNVFFGTGVPTPPFNFPQAPQTQ